jgi:phage terminase large subunit-like protein
MHSNAPGDSWRTWLMTGSRGTGGFLALSTDPADGASPRVATPSIEVTKFE